MTALEEYTAHHPDSVEEIMYRWPWRRFEGMFRLHLLRKAADELRRLRDMRVAALDANTNLDSRENRGAKQEMLEALRRSYEDAVGILYAGRGADEDSVDDYEDDPLFSPIARRRLNEADQPLVAEAGMGRQLMGATP